ncbi:MAG: lysophospholipid acyltransferase family protein [Gammaproteobacteria bacterium]|nr:lysophospholipid acyltransferase family protein [Gammaproteobacteria bacterium]MBU1624435.1 lysophospholipid acyltransferase family protein [Gammaproteobacteria bacterium]MBU1981163.1 lysophospholipid acyltransferase family protein [Gammaproteobacteria bacterium]
MTLLFGILSRLSLPMLYRLGGVFGWLIYWSSRRYAARLRENLQLSGVTHTESEYEALLRANIREAGRGVLELPWVWRRPLRQVVDSVVACHGWEHFENARAEGRGVIMLTPHIGCFEVVGLYVSEKFPMTCMYRPPRYPSLDKLMHQGRERGHMKLASTDLGGVRLLLKALKRGEVIGVLPDQAPGNGEGEWAPFFGRPAYTMTLLGRLVEASGAAVVMCLGERLPRGEGYALHFSPIEFESDSSVPVQLNAALETLIRQHPEQYLWSYNRYKVPRGANPPPTAGEH